MAAKAGSPGSMGIQGLVVFLLISTLARATNFSFQGWLTRRRRPQDVAPGRETGPAPAAPPPIFSALASALEDGLLVIDSNRRISFANDAAADLLGTPTGTLQTQTLMAAVRDYGADQAVERALASGEAQSTIFSVGRTSRTLRLSCQRIEVIEPGAVVILRDLTRLAHLERARREMVANVSHELATPLASVRLLVETLMGEPPPDVARRMMGQIDDELMAMTQLIDELRELAQIESGRLALRLRPSNVADVATRAIERLRPQAARKQLVLAAEFPADLPPALIDEDRIGQVLLNLLHNALKWTAEGGSITVKAVVAAEAPDARTHEELKQVESGGWLKVSLCDTGIGIPADEIERVFERFYKVDRARTRDGGGTGLGLAIAKHLVERHGGRIWAESSEGKGSTFSILLPIAA